MEFLFIKRIVDKNLFDNNSKTIIYKDLFNYHLEKKEIITYSNDSNDPNNNDEYEFITDVNTEPLNQKEEEEKNAYILAVKEEITRIEKVIEYMIVNIPDIHKLKLLNYKTYDYNNTSKFIKSKIKLNSHSFDILKFILKNKINKDEVIMKIKEMTLSDINSSISENKLVVYYLLIKIIDFFNIYNKCLVYSIKLLEEFPSIYRNKDECLSIINNKFIYLANDEINFYHHNQIKNAFATSNKQGELITIKRGSDKNFEILFK